MSEQQFTAMETEWYRLATGTEPRPDGHASAILSLGRAVAEQYQRDNGIGHHLGFLAVPALYQQAMREAVNEQDYLAKCHALGMPRDDAEQVLADTVAVADKGGLPMAAVWERAWQQAIEKSMQ